jgi:hypothetical protein
LSQLPFPRWFIFASLAIAVGALIAGFWLDALGFGSNLLADAVGLPVGVLIAGYLVDRFVESDRERRWQVVSKGTIETLRFAAVKMGLAAYLLLPAPRPPNANPFTMESAGDLPGALQRLAEALRAHGAVAVARQGQLQVPDQVITSGRLVRDVILPRLLLLQAEPELVQPIIELESALETLDYNVHALERFGLPAPAFFESIAKVIDGLRALSLKLD